MRAVVFGEPGDRGVLHLAEVPDPQPGTRQVVVDVVAAGVNRADLLQR
jgi:NADPH:quinone reductase-like Zn-dependent oxidoreductase